MSPIGDGCPGGEIKGSRSVLVELLVIRSYRFKMGTRFGQVISVCVDFGDSVYTNVTWCRLTSRGLTQLLSKVVVVYERDPRCDNFPTGDVASWTGIRLGILFKDKGLKRRVPL